MASRESNGTFPIEHYLHENKCKLLALNCLSEKAIKIFTANEALNSPICPNVHDPNEAFIKILTSSSVINGNVKDWRRIVPDLKYSINDSMFFDKTNRHSWLISSALDIEDLDIPLLVAFLLNIPEFTCCSEKYRLQLACQQCYTRNNRSQIICCRKCGLCTNCKASWQCTCKNYLLCDIFANLIKLRNDTCHMSTGQFVAVDDSKPDGTLYKEWIAKLQSYRHEVESLLLVIRTREAVSMDEHNELMRRLDTVFRNTKDIYFRDFSHDLKFDKKSFVAHFYCSSSNSVIKSFEDDDSQNYKIFFNTLRLLIIDHLEKQLIGINGGGCFDVSCGGFVHPHNDGRRATTFNVTFHIVGKNSNSIPTYLTQILSDEVIALKHKMADLVQKTASNLLRVPVSAKCIGYVLGSITITVEVASGGKPWPHSLVSKYEEELHKCIGVVRDAVYKELELQGLTKFCLSVESDVPDSKAQFKMLVSTFDECLLDLINSQIERMILKSEDYLNYGITSTKSCVGPSMYQTLIKKMLMLTKQPNVFSRTVFYIGQGLNSNDHKLMGIVLNTIGKDYVKFVCQSIAEITKDATINAEYSKRMKEVFGKVIIVIEKNQLLHPTTFEELPLMKQLWGVASSTEKLKLLTMFLTSMSYLLGKKNTTSQVILSLLESEGLHMVDKWWKGEVDGYTAATQIVGILSSLGMGALAAMGASGAAGTVFGPVGTAFAAGLTGVFVFGTSYYIQRKLLNELYTKIFKKTPGKGVLDDALKFYNCKDDVVKELDKKYLEERVKPSVGLEQEKDYGFYSTYRSIIEANEKQRRTSRVAVA